MDRARRVPGGAAVAGAGRGSSGGCRAGQQWRVPGGAAVAGAGRGSARFAAATSAPTTAAVGQPAVGERGEGRFRCAGLADEADRHGHSVKRDPVDPSSGRTWPGTDVMYCHLTRGHVPVHASRSPGSPAVGYLEQGGAGNWFVTEMKGET
ncbi:hypothetical protein [Streptomyces sp. NPDC059349]|uniref:hypothetical protein n=1 Tax=Streptomyces sp. NPDC059349 TaxID=3346808 RepID=UPI0036BD80CC